jgi:hypothetical protein
MALKPRTRSILLWTLAAFLTLTSAVYQRRTGPTYPVRGSVTLGGQEIRYRLVRSHGGPGDQPVVIKVPDTEVSGEVAWRRFPTSDPWQTLTLNRVGENLETDLPHQPPAGKLEYQVRLRRGEEHAVFPPLPAVTRFKGAVPAWLLVPHILAMFLAMLHANRAGLEALWPSGEPRRLANATTLLLVAGGLVLGPAVQWCAFGAWWTGVPFGYDLTDNKTLIAALAWFWALWRLRGGRNARWSVLAASLVTLLVFAIPHSVWGSQLTWGSSGPAQR